MTSSTGTVTLDQLAQEDQLRWALRRSAKRATAQKKGRGAP